MQLKQKAKSKYEDRGITTENGMLPKQIFRNYNIELKIYRDTRALWQKTAFTKATEAFVNTNRYKKPKEYLVSFLFCLNVHYSFLG